MRKALAKINVRWEYTPTPDAEARLTAAFDLLFGQSSFSDTSESQNLTENSADDIMSHGDS